jgi:hypothetical protein
MEIVEAGLEVLENDVISPVTLESIRLMKNRISFIEEDAFRYSNQQLAFLARTSDSSHGTSNRHDLAKPAAACCSNSRWTAAASSSL